MSSAWFVEIIAAVILAVCSQGDTPGPEVSTRSGRSTSGISEHRAARQFERGSCHGAQESASPRATLPEPRDRDDSLSSSYNCTTMRAVLGNTILTTACTVSYKTYQCLLL